MNKTELDEKRYRDKLTKDKEENRLKYKKHKNKTVKLKKFEKTIVNITINYKKQKRQQNNKRKNNMKWTREEL